MVGDFLLDTNILVAVFNEDRQAVDSFKRSTIFVSTIVLGELYFGADASRRVAANRERLESLASRVTVLAINRITAMWYSRIKNQIRTIGKPIPDNDVWIAATAMEHGLALVTRDSHFDHIHGLNLVRW